MNWKQNKLDILIFVNIGVVVVFLYSLLQAPLSFLKNSSESYYEMQGAPVGDSRPMSKAAPAMARLLLDQAQANTSVAENRKLIRNGTLSYQVSQLETTKNKIAEMIKEHKALIINESLSQNSTQATFSIQVPQQNFEALFAAIASLSENLVERRVDVEDVTKQYIDLDEQIKNKVQLRERYRAILSQAKRVEDIMAIERELNGVTEQIDSIQAQLKNYDQRIEYSTIYLTIYEPRAIEPLQKEPYQFFGKLKTSFADGWFKALDFVFLVFSFWPFFIVLAFCIFIWKKRKQARR